MPASPGDALARARKAYQDFFALWNDADEDIPILKQSSKGIRRTAASLTPIPRAILRSVRQFDTLGPKGLIMATKSAISWEDFLAAGEEGQRWEYVDGEVEFMSPVYLRHQAMLFVLIARFAEYRKQHPEWLCFPGDATFTMASGNLRCPDLSIVHASRFPEGKVPDAKADFPPDIVFEIISSGDTASQMARKRKDYQESGVIQVWIDPQRRLVEVVYPDRPSQYIEESQLLAIDKLPGFSLDLHAVFSV